MQPEENLPGEEAKRRYQATVDSPVYLSQVTRYDAVRGEPTDEGNF